VFFVLISAKDQQYDETTFAVALNIDAQAIAV
jgi:hypothetical protein